MARATIALLPGDGIGPEVVDAGRRTLEAVAACFGHRFAFTEARIGGDAIDRTGTPLPDATLDVCRRADAVLLGAVGGPAWDTPGAVARPEHGLLGLRKALELFANVRPVRVYPTLLDRSPVRAALLYDVDLVVVRELTGGLYFGAQTRTPLDDGSGGELAQDTCTYTTMEIERVVRAAGALARARRRKVTSVDKANVLETSRLWRAVTTRVMRDEFPDVTLEHLLVDTCAMQLIRAPAAFDVIVTENMFGDILTDEASVLAGSIGLLPSASLGGQGDRADGTRYGLYEPIHGSAPDIAGQGIANPVGTILSTAMLLRHSLGLVPEACAVERAVHRAIDAGFVTADLADAGFPGASTTAVTNWIVDNLRGDPP